MLALALLISTILPYQTAPALSPNTQVIGTCEALDKDYMIFVGTDGRWAIGYDCVAAFNAYLRLPAPRPLSRA